MGRQSHMGMEMFILFFIQADYLSNGMPVDSRAGYIFSFKKLSSSGKSALLKKN
jgi:hypothetical protein